MATYTDALNRSINLEAPPTRIISLVPSITETLFTFGVGDRVVGVTRFCSEPATQVAGKAKVGGTKTLDVKAVLELKPDLVIANAEENRQEDIRQLLAAGQRVFVTFPRTVAAAIQMLRQLAQMTGSLEAADPILEDAEQTLADARAANQSRTKLRVFCPIWRRPWMTVGPNTYMHDFIAACGGVNVFSERHERYPMSDLDEVARRVPEIILLPDEPYPFTTQALRRTDRVPVRPGRGQQPYISTGWQTPRLVWPPHRRQPPLCAAAHVGRSGFRRDKWSGRRGIDRYCEPSRFTVSCIQGALVPRLEVKNLRMSNVKTVFLLVLLTGLLIGIGYAVAGPAGAIFAFIISLAMNIGSYWFSDKLALQMTGARAGLPGRGAATSTASSTTSSPWPACPSRKVYVIQNDSPNAFATGRNEKHAAVAATTGIMRILDDRELHRRLRPRARPHPQQGHPGQRHRRHHRRRHHVPRHDAPVEPHLRWLRRP